MTNMSARQIGEDIARAAKLPGRALCVFGSEKAPEGSVPLSKVSWCVARAIYKLSADPSTPPVYYGKEAREGICGGGQGWCGLVTMSPKIKYFVSTGTPDFRHGEAEHLRPDPDSAERFFGSPGKITPPRFINIAAGDQIGEDREVLSYIFYGGGEQIRNLGALIHFFSEDLFATILMPAGPSCASLVTYAAGFAEKTPRDTAFVGPVDPTGNAWFPPHLMSLAVPYGMARRMAESIAPSFLAKRPQVASPAIRLGMSEEAPG